MDRNQITGLILISALLLLYSVFFAPKPEDLPKKNDEDSVVAQKTEDNTLDTVSNSDLRGSDVQIAKEYDSTKLAEFGVFATVAEGEEEIITIETETLSLDFSSKGGLLRQVLLKDFYTYNKEPLVLLDQESSHYNFLIQFGNQTVNISDLYFEPKATQNTVKGNDTVKLSFTATIAAGKSIEISYNIPGSGYQVGHEIAFHGLGEVLNDSNFEIIWNNKLKRFESELETSRNNSTINYYTEEDGFDYLSETSTEVEEAAVLQKIKWSTFKQRFFSAGIISEPGFAAGTFRTDVNEYDSSVVKYAQMSLSIPRNFENEKYGFTFYFGPNNYQILKKVAEGFSENVYLGWMMFAWFNKFLIIPIFNFLENYIANYGIIIIILVFIIKLILFPLTYSSYKSFAKQRVLKPELDKLKEKYGEDMQKMQQEQMKLFQQVGINPLSGCIPLLLQMPILLAMFNFFPNSVELRQEGFLWADDLSTYDSILNLPFTIPFYGDHVSLFCLLMTLSTILYQWSNNQMTGQLQGPMKTVTYLMPVMFMFVLNSFSAGLTFYYFVSNLVTFGQQALIRRFIDEEKIKKVLEKNRKKNANKKKSKWALRVEEAMKAREESTKKKQTKR